MTIKDKIFSDLSKNEFQINENQWVINVDKPTICIFVVKWIEDPIDYNRLVNEQLDWDVIKVDCSDEKELIGKYGLSTFPSYICLVKNKPPKLISAYFPEDNLISYVHYFINS